MKNDKYWRDRERENLEHYIQQEKEYDKRIREIYENMLLELQKEIDTFYRKYADSEGITISQAKKAIARLDIEEYERKAKRYVKTKDFSEKANKEMRLYNATMKINRLEMLKACIGLHLINGTEELEAFFEEILQERTIEELERQAGILGLTIHDNAKLAHSIVNASFHNATFSDRLWANQELMKADLDKLLQTGLIRGKNPRELAKDIRKYYIGEPYLKNGKKGAVYNSERLMRTELARVQIDAQIQSIAQNGFTMYTFHANHDCCKICGEMDGKHFYIAARQFGENLPPLHPNCRCSVSGYEDRKEYEAWIDFLDKGGTTAEWNKLKKSGKSVEKSDKSSTIKEQKDNNKEVYLQDTFGNNVDAQITGNKEYKTIVKTRFKQGTNTAKEVFNKYVGKHSIAEINFFGTPHYLHSDKKVHLNIISDLRDERRGKGTQFFHEHGHLIDDKAGSLSTSSKAYSESLKKDFNSYLNKIAKDKKVSIIRATGILENELQNYKKHGISDIIDGLSDGKIIGCASHSISNPNYWKTKGMLEKEAFAHMYESCFDKEKAKYMSEYFPYAYDEFKKLLKGAL